MALFRQRRAMAIGGILPKLVWENWKFSKIITMQTLKCSRSKADALRYLQGILSAGQIFQSKSKDIHSGFLGMRDCFNLPRYDWEYLRGHYDSTVDSWYRHNLIYAISFQGKLYESKWDNLPENVREYVRKTSTKNLASGHFWKNADGTIGKPFFATNIADY